MNYKQANIEICRKITNGTDVVGMELEIPVHGTEKKQKTALVIPGEKYCYGYLFPEKDVAFNWNKVRRIEKEIFKPENICDDNEIKITDFMRILPWKGMGRKFDKAGKDVWVNTEFMKNLRLQDCRFYQNKEERYGIIIAVENGSPAEVFLPIKAYDDE